MAVEERTRERLSPEVCDLPVEKMREGYYTDAYFNHARATLLQDGRRPRVVMQVFQKKHSFLGGMDEAIAILKLCSHDWEALTVHALHDGDRIEPWETVLTIEGDYALFAHLETVYLGVLARRTLITTNVVRVLEAANGKPIIFMPARHLGVDGRPLALGRDGGLSAVRGQRATRPQGAGRARPGRLRACQDRRLGRLHRRQDPRVRGEGRAGRLVRRRLLADPRLERL